MEIKNIFNTPKEHNYFFGYYDKSQLNMNNDLLLCHRYDGNNLKYNNNDQKCAIGYFKLFNNQFVEIAKTSAFNFQQGAMLQWVGPNYNDKIIYNVIENNKLFSEIYSIKNKIKIRLSDPIYSLSADGKYALTLNFKNLSYFKRGYGYDMNKISQKKINNLNPVIRLIDIEKDESRTIIDEKNLNFLNSNYWIEHIFFSPNSINFAFIVRRKLKDGGVNTSLYISDIKESSIFKINNSGRGSHFNWIDGNNLIIYGGVANSFNKFRKNNVVQKILPFKQILSFYKFFFKHNSLGSKLITGDTYFIYNIINQKITKINSIKLNSEDGHPSTRPGDNNLMLTDTYSDTKNKKKAKILLFDINKQLIILKEELNSIEDYDNSPFRSDLHPRWSVDGKFFSVDTLDQGIRSSYVYMIN